MGRNNPTPKKPVSPAEEPQLKEVVRTVPCTQALIFLLVLVPVFTGTIVFDPTSGSFTLLKLISH
jgi:hypothetical protein